VYDREIEGQEFTFGVSGKLLMNVLVMYDRQTDSLWSQLLGKAIQGPLAGTKLSFVASLQTTWAEWKALHPNTRALQKTFRGGFDGYTSYYQSLDAGVLGESRRDNRLETKEFVVGVAVDGVAKAYPFRRLNDSPVVNDELNGQPLLVVFDQESATGAVFSRVVDGSPLTFQLATPGGLHAARLVDDETGSIWSAFTGQAVEGLLAGTRLEPVRSTSSFWFGWKDFYPTTEVYGTES
jgi:hypothetical protein